MLAGSFARLAREAEARGDSTERLTTLLGKGRARKGVFEGDLEEGYMEAGEVAGDIREIIPAGEVVKRMIAEFNTAVIKVRQVIPNDSPNA